jgi:hypothetical protein
VKLRGDNGGLLIPATLRGDNGGVVISSQRCGTVAEPRSLRHGRSGFLEFAAAYWSLQQLMEFAAVMVIVYASL